MTALKKCRSNRSDKAFYFCIFSRNSMIIEICKIFQIFRLKIFNFFKKLKKNYYLNDDISKILDYIVTLK